MCAVLCLMDSVALIKVCGRAQALGQLAEGHQLAPGDQLFLAQALLGCGCAAEGLDMLLKLLSDASGPTEVCSSPSQGQLRQAPCPGRWPCAPGRRVPRWRLEGPRRACTSLWACAGALPGPAAADGAPAGRAAQPAGSHGGAGAAPGPALWLPAARGCLAARAGPARPGRRHVPAPACATA